MPTTECTNEECMREFEYDLNDLDRESNGSSGTHTTSYTYSGAVECPHCETYNELEFETDEVDDTGEIL